MDQHTLILYLSSVTVIGVLLLWWISRHLQKIESEREKHLKKKREFLAVSTESPLPNPTRSARRTALASISERFTIIRRLLYILITLIWVALLIYPFLGAAPKALISMMITIFAVLIGIAAKPFVENFVSGIVISFSKNLRTGDTLLMDGEYGTIEDITLTHTIVKLWDWRRYIVPNSRMLNKDFLHYSLRDSTQWARVEFWIDYHSDIETVREIAIDIAQRNEFFSNVEPPEFWVIEMAEAAIKCWLVAWADTPSDAWSLKLTCRLELIKAFKARGINAHLHHIHWHTTPMEAAMPLTSPDSRGAPRKP